MRSTFGTQKNNNNKIKNRLFFLPKVRAIEKWSSGQNKTPENSWTLYHQYSHAATAVIFRTLLWQELVPTWTVLVPILCRTLDWQPGKSRAQLPAFNKRLFLWWKDNKLLVRLTRNVTRISWHYMICAPTPTATLNKEIDTRSFSAWT